MSIMDRLSRLIRANVNYQIDRAEDPVVMLEQILRENQSDIASARVHVRDMIALEKSLAVDFREAGRIADEWGQRAELAAIAGRDDLARNALVRKRDYDENARISEQQLIAQQQAVARIKYQLQQLESKYQTTLSRKDVLIARQRRAKAQSEVAKHLTELSPGGTSAEMDRMERKIRINESLAAATAEIADSTIEMQFMELDDPLVEEDLRKLKERIAQGHVLPGHADHPMLSDPDELEREPEPGALLTGL